MFKGKSLQKFLIRARWFVLSFFLIILAITVGVNAYLSRIHEDLIAKISQKLNYTLSIGNFYYQFPNSFYFYDVGIKTNNPQDQGSSIDLNKIKVKLSLPELFYKKQILISDIKVYNSRLTSYDLQKFLARNLEFLKNVFKNMPEGNAKIQFYDINLIFLDNKEMILDCYFKVNQNAVTGIGRLKKVLYMKENLANEKTRNFLDVQNYKFRLNALISDGMFLIDSLDVNHLNYQSKLWGDISENELNLKGYMVIDTFAKRKEKKVSAAQSFLSPIKDFFRNDIFFFPEDQLINPNVHVLDIDTIIKFQFPIIQLSRLNFTVNNTPIKINGTLDFTKKFKAQIACKVLPSSKMVFFKESQINAFIDTSEKQNEITGNFIIDFKKGASDYSLKRIQAYYEELSFDLDKIIPLEIFVKKLKVVCSTNMDQHSIELENLKGSINNLNSNLKIVDFSSPLYSGSVKGRVWMKTNKWPADVSSTLFVKGVESNKLSGLYSYFSKTHGKLNGQVNFLSEKDMELTGHLWIDNGRLVNFDFFQWLSESFEIPSLKEISFSKAITDFKIDSDSVTFEEFYLDSPDVRMEGYYSVDSYNLVSSILQLTFSKDVLGESRKFKPILKMFKDNPADLPFKFQLSGNQDNMNFYWMDSSVKERIQEKIPNFIERRIEKGIDRMVNEPVAP